MNGKQHPLCALLEVIEQDAPSVQPKQLEVEPTEHEQEVWQFEPSICG